MKSTLLTLAAAFCFANISHANVTPDHQALLAKDVVEFHIAAGTNEGPWNTMETTVEVKVGQILRLVNDDSIAHFLHTPGQPCPHGSHAFGPGQTYDCVISDVADPSDVMLYDHQFGPDARFYVRATQ